VTLFHSKTCRIQKNIVPLHTEAATKGGKMEGLHIAARNMKQLGISVADIAKATGLSETGIANL